VRSLQLFGWALLVALDSVSWRGGGVGIDFGRSRAAGDVNAQQREGNGLAPRIVRHGAVKVDRKRRWWL
jgi:hypothetical protein